MFIEATSSLKWCFRWDSCSELRVATENQFLIVHDVYAERHWLDDWLDLLPLASEQLSLYCYVRCDIKIICYWIGVGYTAQRLPRLSSLIMYRRKFIAYSLFAACALFALPHTDGMYIGKRCMYVYREISQFRCWRQDKLVVHWGYIASMYVFLC